MGLGFGQRQVKIRRQTFRLARDKVAEKRSSTPLSIPPVFERLGIEPKHETVVSPQCAPLLRHDMFSVEQLSSTVSEAGTNFTTDKRLGQSFYNR